MSDFDLIIRGGRAVLPDGEHLLDVGIRDGRIEALAPAVFGSTDADLDATGFHLFPGVVDACVRLGPSDAHALAAGGVTTCLDFPGGPPVRDRASLDAHRAAAASPIDYALWGALTATNLHELEDLAEGGVIGFHADLSGPDAIDDGALLEGMIRAETLKQIVSVQAENGSVAAHFARAAVAEGRLSVRDYLDSRPVVAELEAVQRAILLAWEAECAIHFPQVSTGEALELIAAAKAQGLNVSCSTSPHYLLLTDEDAERLGAVAKCAPPLRGAANVDALWAHLAAGAIDLIVSGHRSAAPAAPGAHIFAAPLGLSAGPYTLGLMLAEALGTQRPIPLERLSELLATSPARRFRLHPQKGELIVGADADVLIIDLNDEAAPQTGHGPYAGRALRGRVLRSLLRGQTVFNEQGIVGEPSGRFVQAPADGSAYRPHEEPVTHLAQEEDVPDHERHGQADVVQRADPAEAQNDEPQ